MSLARVLIVDDEPLARQRLRLLLKRLPDLVEIVGEVDGCLNAVTVIEALQPDLIFLDVQLRDGTGFALIDLVPRAALPPIIFVTAYDGFAVRAFEAGALDYVLKPVRPDRLKLAIQRALSADPSAVESRLAQLAHRFAEIHDLNHRAESEEQEFWVRRGNGDLTRVASTAIDWAAVEDNYVRLHVGNESYLVRESVRGLAKRLGPDFMQVHRSTIVRTAAIAKIAPDRLGLLDIVLKSGPVIKAGRIYAKELRRVFRSHSTQDRHDL